MLNPRQNIKCSYSKLQRTKIGSLFLLVFVALYSNSYAHVNNDIINAEYSAYQLTVSGAITDNLGEPLPGASIMEKGTTNGTTTDFDGNFSIDVSDENAILVISYIGFTTQEVNLNGNLNISVTLLENAAALSEVVVTGYTSERKVI